jgi:hypothetical protein
MLLPDSRGANSGTIATPMADLVYLLRSRQDHDLRNLRDGVLRLPDGFSATVSEAVIVDWGLPGMPT